MPNPFLPLLYTALLLCTPLTRIQAQPSTLHFRKINTDNGLSHNKVNCILQDQRGFMWIGTEDGLNRYDGNDVLIFRSLPGRTDGLSGNIIQALFEDPDGVLWIGTADGGLNRYDYRLPPAQQFRQYKYNPHDTASIPVNTINAIIQDRKGFLWLATSGSIVVRFDPRTETFLVPVNEGRRTALALGLDHQDTLWVGRQGGGILKIDTRSLRYTTDPRYDNLYADLPHVVITSLYEDRRGQMWYGSWDKVLYKYQPAKREEQTIAQHDQPYSFIHDEITDIAEDHQGRLWFAGKNSGLQMLDPATNRFYAYQYSPQLAGTIADDRVNCIYIDATGHIWAGTQKGVSTASLHPQFVQQFLPGTFDAGQQPVTIFDFYQDPNDALWIGTSQGIYIRKKDSDAMTHFPLIWNGQALAVTDFYRDVDGTLYLGTNQSLFRCHPETYAPERLPNTEKDDVMNKLIESRVVSVIRDTIDRHPVLLTSPYGHYLAYYDLTDQQWISRMDTAVNLVETFDLRDNLIRKLYRGRDGNIWMAMATKGIGRWPQQPPSKVTYFSHQPGVAGSLTNNNVFDLTDDGAGHFWVTTYGGGLQYFNTERETFYHIAASDNLLEGIAGDGQGRLWMIGGGVLHRFDPRDSSYVTFDLPDLQNAGGVRGYIFKDREGWFYIAGTNYFISFHPDQVHPEVIHTDVLFTDFKIFNHSFSDLLFQENISLRYNQNYFTIEFAAPHYPGSEKVVYRYRLVGVDEDWVYAGSRNSVSYPNTGSGRFTFHVQASTDLGRWPDTMASLSITVVPPVWKRWWFLTLAVILIAVLVMAIQRYRLNEVLKRQAIRNRIAQDLHDTIGSTLSSISVYSQVARIRHEKNDDEQLEELLEKIGSTSNAMISDMNDIVWAINPRNDSMEKIIQRMESFARPMLAARHIQLEIDYPQEVLQANLDMEKRKNLYLVFKEAIHNAFKYAACTLIRVQLRLTGQALSMTLQDNGVGFVVPAEGQVQKDSLSGNGLDNMRSRAAEMGGHLDIRSTPGEGTTITLTVNIP